MNRCINGKTIPLTEQEIADREAEQEQRLIEETEAKYLYLKNTKAGLVEEELKLSMTYTLRDMVTLEDKQHLQKLALQDQLIISTYERKFEKLESDTIDFNWKFTGGEVETWGKFIDRNEFYEFTDDCIKYAELLFGIKEQYIKPEIEAIKNDLEALKEYEINMKTRYLELIALSQQ